MIPATEYFFSWSCKFLLISSDKNTPLYGLILINTLPYCGGFKSSPPYAATDSASPYNLGTNAS